MLAIDRAPRTALSRFEEVGRIVIALEPDDSTRMPTILAYLDELLAELHGDMRDVPVIVIVQAWAAGRWPEIDRQIKAWRTSHGLPATY